MHLPAARGHPRRTVRHGERVSCPLDGEILPRSAGEVEAGAGRGASRRSDRADGRSGGLAVWRSGGLAGRRRLVRESVASPDRERPPLLRTFIACLGTETNTFSPMPTGMQTFEEGTFYHGDATRHPPDLFSEPLHVWRRMTEERQGQTVESLAAFAQPGGTTVRAVYERLRDEILDDLRRAGPVDVVLLAMHGAMVAEGYDDCEGDLLARVRAIVGPEVVVGAELDLHCSVTARMLANADVIVTFKEYPHVDGAARAAELFDICVRAREGAVRPVMAVHDCRMINMWRTPVEPFRSVVAQMQAAEGRDGVLSVSFAHGFPWGDVADASAKVLVVADGEVGIAERTARNFGDRIWDLREQCRQPTVDITAALDALAAAPRGPVVLADVADNAGGGAPSDSTFVLAALLERGIGNVLVGHFWDPIAVRFCQEAGEGATLDLRIGGKCGVASGMPIDLRVTVRRIVADARQSFGTSTSSMGTAVWVSTDDGIDLTLNTRRTQVFHPDGFEQLGIDLAARHGIVVKSTQHFYDGFAPIASEVIYVAAPGAIPPDFAAIPYTKFTTAYWPRVEDPFAAG
ncbi:MAG: M81 family metallopeptidase [Ectothiorhodospiraceae bacterium]|nr:M81 family metallopeptidase [Ectothiorhodospiraceae bacterium]